MPKPATPAEEEQAAQKKRKHIEKMQKAAAKAREQKAKDKAKEKGKYKTWLKEEKDAYEDHVKDPNSDKKLKAWIACWRREPSFKEPDDQV